jgi:zinc protease
MKLSTLLATALAGCLGLAVSLPVLARGSQPRGDTAFPFAVAERTLPNGLKMYAVKFDSPGLVAYYSIVRTGSRNEVEPGKSGFAHFFEHMMFRGTDRFPEARYQEIMKAIGANENAYTSDDMTVYHELASSSALTQLVEIEADRFQNLKYREPEFQKEARAVLGEYNKSSSDPMLKMEETLDDTAFASHPYKHTTIGFLKDIEDMPNQYAFSRRFFDHFYRPDNVVLLVVGDVDPEAFFALAEKHYGSWKKGPPRPPVPREPVQTREKRVQVSWPAATLPILFEGYHVPAFSATQNDFAALQVLGELLFAERSPLYKRLVLEEQKVERLEGGADPHVDPNLFQVLARIKKPEDMGYVEKAVHDELARLAREGTDDKTLREVLSHLRYAFAARLSTADRVADIGARFIALTGNLAGINDYYQLVGRVTAADVKRVAEKYFRASNRTVITMKAGAK